MHSPSPLPHCTCTRTQALDQHFDCLFPKDCQPWKSQALEAFLLAHRNLYITYEQRNKQRAEMASAALIWMRVSPPNRLVTYSPPHQPR